MQTLTVRASLAKFSPEFTIHVEVSSSSSASSSSGSSAGAKKKGGKSGNIGVKKASLVKSVGAWIDVEGNFSHEALLKDMKRLIEAKAE